MEEVGPSFLDNIDRRAKREDGTLPPTYSRIIVIAEIEEGVKPNQIIEYNEELLDGINRTLGCKTTGLLLVQERCLLHFLETPQDACLEFLKSLREQESGAEGQETLLTKVTILHSAEDCPVGYFNKWYCFQVQPTAEPGVDLAKENILDAAHSIFTKMVEAADVLRKQQADFTRRYLYLIPSAERILACCESDELFKIGEYMDLFHFPINVELESEKMWPVMPLVTY